MRHSVVVIAIIPLTGAWVCDGHDPCSPTELTCPSDVAEDVCCPQGKPYLCGGQCSASTDLCPSYVTCRYAGDNGTNLCTAGTFTATIEAITCTKLAYPSPGAYSTAVMGSAFGCGSTPLIIVYQSDQETALNASCGTWTLGQPSGLEFNGVSCVSDATTEADETRWEVDGGFVAKPGAEELPVSVYLQIGDDPVLASATMSCPYYQ